MKSKIIAAVVASSLSSLVLAHGHYPQEINQYVVDSVYEVEFNLSNHFDKKTCFSIEVNGEILTPYRTCLNNGQSKKMKVWVNSPADVQTENIVCSIAENPGSIRTRMCTSAITLYPLSYLAEQ